MQCSFFFLFFFLLLVGNHAKKQFTLYGLPARAILISLQVSFLDHSIIKLVKSNSPIYPEAVNTSFSFINVVSKQVLTSLSLSQKE